LAAAAILTVDIENVVQYQENYANQAKNGTSAVMGPSIGAPATYSPGYFIGDISAINGTKTKGTTLARNVLVNLSANPTGSQAIADVSRFQAMDTCVLSEANPARSRTLNQRCLNTR
jgi:hypothetical protein